MPFLWMQKEGKPQLLPGWQRGKKKRAGFLIESAHIQKNPPLINGVLFIFLVTVVLSYFVPKKQLLIPIQLILKTFFFFLPL